MKDMLKFKDFDANQHKVQIDVLANGFVVRVGCKKFVCENLDEMMRELFAYFKGEFTDLSKQFKDQIPLTVQTLGNVGIGSTCAPEQQFNITGAAEVCEGPVEAP